MQLLSVQDPRDNLEKANRDELAKYAKEMGVSGITEETPEIVSRKILRSLGFVNIKPRARPLGSYQGKSFGGQSITDTTLSNSIDADVELERQWKQEQAAPKNDIPTTMGAMRKACKERGIKFSPRDKMQTLKEKLNGQNAA